MAIDDTCDRIDKINTFVEFRVRFVNLMIIYANYMQINVTHTKSQPRLNYARMSHEPIQQQRQPR